MNGIGKGVIAGAVMASIILFVGMCLFIASWAIIDPTYMGICRNKITQAIEKDKIYFEGRHFIGVGNEFITYPMAWQLIEFTDDDDPIGESEYEYLCKQDGPLDASTSNGLAMSIEVSIYFSMPPQQIINFYTSFGSDRYANAIADECVSELKHTASQFKYEEVFKGRLMISEAMTRALNRSLSRRRCVLEKLLLRGIYFSDVMESNIESSVMADQRAAANKFLNDIAMIHADIDRLKKEYGYKVNVVLAEAQKNVTLLIEDAKAYANSVYANSTATAWRQYQAETELDTESLLRVQWARTLGATTSKDSIALGYDTVGTQFVQKVKNA